MSNVTWEPAGFKNATRKEVPSTVAVSYDKDTVDLAELVLVPQKTSKQLKGSTDNDHAKVTKIDTNGTTNCISVVIKGKNSACFGHLDSCFTASALGMAFVLAMTGCGRVEDISIATHNALLVQEQAPLAEAEIIGNRVSVDTGSFYASCAYGPRDPVSGEVEAAYLLQVHGDNTDTPGLPRLADWSGGSNELTRPVVFFNYANSNVSQIEDVDVVAIEEGPAWDYGSFDHNFSNQPSPLSVTFSRSYQNPVVMADIRSRNNNAPMAARVTNVTSTGADIIVVVPSGQGAQNLNSETVNWVVFESGTHTLADGSLMVVGTSYGYTNASGLPEWSVSGIQPGYGDTLVLARHQAAPPSYGGVRVEYNSSTSALLHPFPSPPIDDAIGYVILLPYRNITSCGYICGDSLPSPEDDCDDGNRVANDGCSPQCSWECGDGTISPIEECDDRNREAGDGCSPTCQLEGVCGNGARELSEYCDDGNVVSGDGCSSTCTIESTCGDGYVELGEICDGPTNGSDGCSSSCASLSPVANIPDTPYCNELRGWSTHWEAMERTLLDEINIARSKEQTCRGKKVGPVPPITWDDTLACASRHHSMEMALLDFYSHNNPYNGSTLRRRVEATGFTKWATGEVLARSRGHEAWIAVMGWLRSETGHCEYIMREDTKIGGAGYANQVSPSSPPGTLGFALWTFVGSPD